MLKRFRLAFWRRAVLCSPAYNMATFAVCMSAQEGSKIVWSLVASIDLNGTFATLFDRHNNDRYNFASAHVAVSPSGPWQDIRNDETLDVLRVLNMRHILFKVSSKGAVEADTKKQSTDGLQLFACVCFKPNVG